MSRYSSILLIMINLSVSLFAIACLIMQIHKISHKTILGLTANKWLHVFGICGHIQFAHCTLNLLLYLKHLFITKVSLERDLRWKVQHLQHDLCLEVKNLIMLCIRGVCLLFSFVILHLNIIDVKPDVVFGQTC